MKKVIAYLMGAGASLLVTFKIPAGVCVKRVDGNLCTSLSELYFTISAIALFCAAVYLFIEEEANKK